MEQIRYNVKIPYTKNMGVMLQFFFYLNSRVGGGEEWCQGSLGPSGHALVLT